MKALIIAALMAVFLNATLVWAQEPAQDPSDTNLETITTLDPETLETRTEAVSKTLRCVVCQNQSIFDSNAPLAEDMRRLVRKRVEAGDSDDEVRAYLRDRYGDYVLMSPPWQMNTLLLWLGPGFLVFLGGIWFILRLRSAPGETEAALSETDRARIAAALSDQGPSQ